MVSHLSPRSTYVVSVRSDAQLVLKETREGRLRISRRRFSLPRSLAVPLLRAPGQPVHEDDAIAIPLLIWLPCVSQMPGWNCGGRYVFFVHSCAKMNRRLCLGFGALWLAGGR